MQTKVKGCTRVGLFLAGCILLASFCSAAAIAQVPANIGFVELQKVIQEYKKNQDLQQKLEAQNQNNQEEFLQKKTEIDELKEKLKIQESLLDVEAMREQAKRIEEKESELRTWQKEKSDEFNAQKRRYTEEILGDILAVIRTLAVQENYQFILDRGTLLYAAPEEKFDLTDKVLSLLNQEGGQE